MKFTRLKYDSSGSRLLADFLVPLMARFSNYDRNADRDPAIVSLKYLDFEPSDDTPTIGRLVLVLVESRLLESASVPKYLIIELLGRIQRFKGDLEAEGYTTRFINADLYHGNRHQDGRTLLAIRSFLREVNRNYSWISSTFVGVIMVGAFPEASIVRNVIWKPGFKDQIIGGISSGDNPYLAIGNELIAPRSEIVLADLHGNWEALYHENLTGIENIRALPDPNTASTDWPVDGQIFVSQHYDKSTNYYLDFFYVNDADYQIISAGDHSNTDLWISIRRKRNDPELGPGTNNNPNPIASPDILVSRINALQVAINPNPIIQGDDGTKPLDLNGNPQPFTSVQDFPTDMLMFRQDRIFEYKLLCDYFDRNHRFRSGACSDLLFRVGAIAYPRKDFKAEGYAIYLSGASNEFGLPLVKEDATLLDYIRWYKEPAVLRYIIAHSNDKESQFGSEYDVSEFGQVTGGKPFRWHKNGTTYEPSFLEQGGSADLFVHRTVWQNGVLSNSGGNLIVHDGCEVNSSKGTQIVPYYVEGYATFQNGEGILFYMNGIALLARAKVFNDKPRGFPGAFGTGPHAKFGQGWRAYFDIDAADLELGKFENSIKCKRTYFWSVIGDWSVRLRYQQGLGVLNFVANASGSPIVESAIHSDDSWIGRWYLDAFSNTVFGRGGDMDGNSVDEFLITNNRGVALLNYDNDRWKEITIVKNDDWCGAWRYNSSENENKDAILGFWNLIDPNTKSLLLVNEWGIGVLHLTGGNLTSVIAQPNGTIFGQWAYDSRVNDINQIGDFDGDGIDELLVTNDFGLAILKTFQDTFITLTSSSSGTAFGQWVFDASDNINGVGDLDGDGTDEILIINRNDGRVGILKFQGTNLVSVVVYSNGTDLGGYIVNTSHGLLIEDNISGNMVANILVRDRNVGNYLLVLENQQLKYIASLKFGETVGSGQNTWKFSVDDTMRVIGDLTGINSSEIFVRNSNGIGILGFVGGKFVCTAKYDYGTKMGEWILEPGDHFGVIQRIMNDKLKNNLLVKKGRYHTDTN